MSNRLRNNLLATLFVVVLLVLLVLLAGCAGQGVKLNVETSGTPCGTKKVQFSTDYQVEQLEIGRTIEGGGEDGGGSEGCGGGYTVTLGKGTTKDTEVGLILEMFKMVMSVAGFPVAGAGAPTTPKAGTPSTQELFDAGVQEGRRLQSEIFNRR